MIYLSDFFGLTKHLEGSIFTSLCFHNKKFGKHKNEKFLTFLPKKCFVLVTKFGNWHFFNWKSFIYADKNFAFWYHSGDCRRADC